MLINLMLTNALVCREESERISELKSISGTSRLPAGSLASGVEGIKLAITNFDDAYVDRWILRMARASLTSFPIAVASRISKTSVFLQSSSTPTTDSLTSPTQARQATTLPPQLPLTPSRNRKPTPLRTGSRRPRRRLTCRARTAPSMCGNRVSGRRRLARVIVVVVSRARSP